MNCINHGNVPAQGFCVTCGNPYCLDCLVNVGGQPQCKACLNKGIPINNRNQQQNYSQDYVSYNSVPLSDDGERSSIWKKILWVIMMIYVPFMGIFVDRFKPFGKGGNLFCKIYGWIVTVVAVISLVIFLIFGSLFAIGASGVADESFNDSVNEVINELDEAANEFSKEKYTISNLDYFQDDYTTYAVGKITNNTSRTMNYMQVEIGLYDADGNVVGSAFDNVNNIGPGETWSFKALIWDTSGVATFRVNGVTGF